MGEKGSLDIVLTAYLLSTLVAIQSHATADES
jgi:hypothetical protein